MRAYLAQRELLDGLCARGTGHTLTREPVYARKADRHAQGPLREAQHSQGRSRHSAISKDRFYLPMPWGTITERMRQP